MILRTGTRRSKRICGLTLVELLLVMTLLIVVVAISVPALSAFFRGRTLDSEGRRLLSLTRYAQSRAVSEGVPVLLWFDTEERRIGLEEEPGYTEKDSRAREYLLDPELQMEIEETLLRAPQLATGLRAPQAAMLAESSRRGLPEIRFLPDGYADVTSPEAIRVWDRSGASLWLARSTNRLSYELRREYRP